MATAASIPSAYEPPDVRDSSKTPQGARHEQLMMRRAKSMQALGEDNDVMRLASRESGALRPFSTASLRSHLTGFSAASPRDDGALSPEKVSEKVSGTLPERVSEHIAEKGVGAGKIVETSLGATYKSVLEERFQQLSHDSSNLAFTDVPMLLDAISKHHTFVNADIMTGFTTPRYTASDSDTSIPLWCAWKLFKRMNAARNTSRIAQSVDDIVAAAARFSLDPPSTRYEIELLQSRACKTHLTMQEAFTISEVWLAYVRLHGFPPMRSAGVASSAAEGARALRS